MASQRPSEEQRRALAAYGIVAPESESACRCLLDWISNGGSRKDERIAMIKSTYSKFVGKKVRHLATEEVGEFLYLTWRGLAFRANSRRSPRHKFTHPLDATVKWPRGTSTTSVGSLEVVE